MAVAHHHRNALFSLRLEQGGGRLVLQDREVSDLLIVDEMRLDLAELPSRLDLSAGVERFRHQRSELNRLVVVLEDEALGRFVRVKSAGGPLHNLELRALDGEVVIVGDFGEDGSPFIVRLRLESAGVGDERSLLLSCHDIRVFGPAAISAPQVAEQLFKLVGLDAHLVGPTACLFDPLGPFLAEICAELGWKMPSRSAVRMGDVVVGAGQIRLTFAGGLSKSLGSQTGEQRLEHTARARHFLADYEAKSLYAHTEALVSEGRMARAIRQYSRQLELHPENSFLIRRLLQLQVLFPESWADAISLARQRLASHPDDLDALTAMATLHWRSDHVERAVDCFERLAELADRRGDGLESAQARCAIAILLSPTDPSRALQCLETALAQRARLPGVLHRLASLQADAGDWAASLKTRERLLAAEDDRDNRVRHLLELGTIAVQRAGDLEAARHFYERALRESGDETDALLGLADVQEQSGEFLSAVRTLDRVARMLQLRGDASAAADVVTRLGQLWCQADGDGVETAALRFRQAISLVPHHPGALLGLADVALLQGDSLRARHSLEELLRGSDAGRMSVDRFEIYLKLGQVLLTDEADQALAISYLQKALHGEGEQVSQALDILEALYRDTERWDDLARLLEQGVRLAPAAGVDSSDYLVRLADVVSTHHRDGARAIELLEKATEETVDEDLLNTLMDLYRQADNHSDLARVIERLAETVTEPGRLAELYTERADLLRVYLNESAAAADSYGRALGCRYDYEPAITGLADIYREQERFGELASLLERLAAVQEGPQAAESLLELARLEAWELDRVSDSVKHLELAADLAPKHPGILRLLGDLYFSIDRYDLALERYTVLRDLYDTEGYDEAVAPFLMRLAEVLDGLGRREDAVDLLRRSVEMSPDVVQTYELAQDLLLSRGTLSEVIDFLEYGLERAIRPQTRFYLAKRLGRLIWREVRNAERAAVVLDEAARYEPDDDDLRRMRLEVATALADWSKVSDLLGMQLEAASSDERPALLVSLAKLAYNELGRLDEGEQFVQAALAERDDYIPALSLLGDKSFETGRWQRAREAFEALEGLEGVHARPEDRYRLAVSLLKLGDAEDAYERLRALRREGAYFAGSSGAYVEACLATHNLSSLGAGLGTLDDTPVSERVELLRRSARAYESSGAHAHLAEAIWRQIIGLAPDDSDAMDAIEAAELDGLKTKKLPTVRDDADVVPPATEPLPHLVSDGDTFVDAPLEVAESASGDGLDQSNVSDSTQPADELIEDVASASDPAETVQRDSDAVIRGDAEANDAPPAAAPSEVEQTAEFQSLGGVQVGAESLDLDDIFDPDDDELPPLASRNLPSAEEMDDPQSLAQSMADKIADEVDPVERASVALQLAELRRDRLHDPEGAMPFFRIALTDATPLSETWTESLEALEDLLALRSEWSELLELYDLRGEVGETELPAVALLKASVLRTAGQLEEAATQAEQALSLGDRALDLLVVILESLNRHEDAAERLLVGLERLSADDRGHRLWRAGELAVEANPERALGWLTQARDLLDEPELVDLCIRLARSVGQTEVLVTSLETRASQLNSDGAEGIRRSSLLLEAANLSLSVSGEQGHARELLEKSLQAWPDNVDALTALISVVESQGDEAVLLSLYRRQLDMLLPGPHRAQLAKQLIELAEKLSVELDDESDLVVIVQQESPADHQQSPNEQNVNDLVSELVSQANQMASTPGALPTAVSLLEEALGLEPNNRDAYRALALLYADAEMVPELCGVLERQAAVMGADPERAELLLRRGLIARDELGEPDAAAHAFERVVGDSAASVESTKQALYALTTLRSRRVDFDMLSRTLDARCDEAAGTAQEDALREIAAMVRQSLEQSE